MRRRALLALLGGGAAASLAACARAPLEPGNAAALARLGVAATGGVLLLRHAKTDDFPEDLLNINLGDCVGQRNLSDAGAEQALALGQFLRRAGLAPDEVLASPFCRCIDTSRLAFGTMRIEPDLRPLAGLDEAGVAARVESMRGMVAQATAAGRLVAAVGHSDLPEALGLAKPAECEGYLLVEREGALAAVAALRDAPWRIEATG